jgi:hypothetical protein
MTGDSHASAFASQAAVFARPSTPPESRRGFELGSKGPTARALRCDADGRARLGARAVAILAATASGSYSTLKVPHPHQLPPSSHERVVLDSVASMFLDPDMTRGIGATGPGLYICSELSSAWADESGSSRARGRLGVLLRASSWASRVRSRGRTRPSRPEGPAPRAARPGLSPRARAARGRRGRSPKRCRPPR